jgi:GNAT superfamily N-acetyltransferase
MHTSDFELCGVTLKHFTSDRGRPNVRFAEYADLSGVLHLYKELRPHDPELAAHDADARWGELLDQPHVRVVVAEVQGCLASTCMIASITNLASAGRPFAVIEHVVTLPQFRGHGLARATLQHALDFAWSKNCCKVMLLSGMQRPDAHRLYESVGFRGDIERGFVIKPVAAS